MMKLHHIALTVNDIDATIKWYQDIFGFQVIRRHKKRSSEIAHITLDDIRIELFDYGQETKPLPEYRQALFSDLKVIGVKHFCLEATDLEKTVEDLRSQGVEIVTEIDTAGFGGKYVFIKDCNGVLIELYQE